MGNLYERISALCSDRGVTGYRLCKDIGIQPSIMTDLKSGRKKGLSAETAQKIAEYFGVSVGYLLGKEEFSIEESIPEKEEKPSTDEDDLKFALFGGEEEITDEMFEEVKAFAEFVKQKYKKK